MRAGIRNSRLWPHAVNLLLLLLFLVSLVLLAYALVQRPSVQDALVEILSRRTGYGIRTGRIELDLLEGTGVRVRGLQAATPDGAKSIQAACVRVTFDPVELLKGRIKPRRVTLIQPHIQLAVRATDPVTSLPHPNDIPPLWIPGLESLSVEKGSLRFLDHAWRLEDLDLEVRCDTGEPLPLEMGARGRFVKAREAVDFNIKGRGAPCIDTGAAGPFTMQVRTGPIPVSVLPRMGDLSIKDGFLECTAVLESGENTDIKISGAITGQDLQLELQRDERLKGFFLPFASLAFSGDLVGKMVLLPRLVLETPGLKARCSVELDLEDRGNPWLRVDAQTEFLSIDPIKKYLPGPLLPAWVEERLLPLLAQGEARLESMILQGRLQDLAGDWGPAQRDKFSLKVACRNFVVTGGGIPYPFVGVGARIEYVHDDFILSDLSSQFQDSRLRDSGLTVEDVSEDGPGWDIFVKGDFGLQTLREQRGIVFLPPDVLQKLAHVGEISGRLSCEARFRYEPHYEFPRTREGSFVLEDCEVLQPELRLPLFLSRAEIRVSEDDKNSFRAKGAWGLSTFEATGIFGRGDRVFPLRSARIAAFVDMNEAIPAVFQGYTLPLAFQQPVRTHLDLENAAESFSCKGKVDLAGVTLRNDRVRMRPPGAGDHITFDLGFGPSRRVSVKEAECFFRGSKLTLSGGFDLERRDLFTMNLKSPGLDLEDLGLSFREHGRPGAGTIRGDIKIVGSIQDPLTTAVLGSLRGEGIAAHLDWLASPIQEGSFVLNFSGKKVQVAECSMLLGKSTLEVEGELTGWNEIGGRIKVFAPYMEVRDFLPEDRPGDKGGIPRNLDIRAEIHGLHGKWRNLDFGPLRAEIRIERGQATLARSRIRLDHGVITSSGHYQREPIPEVSLSNHVRLTGQPLLSLLRDVGMETTAMDGSLNMEAYLTMNGREISELLPSMSGNADITVRDGYIRRSSLFMRILDHLSLKKIFQSGPSDLPEGAFGFKEINGFAVIDRGVLATENATMSSTVYNAVAAGEVDLIGQKLDLTMGIRPLETMDTLVSKIPILGYAITGKDKSFLTYYFEVRGPMTEPDVRHVPFKHLGGGVAGVLKRLFLSPVRLYGDITRGSAPPEGAPSERQE